MASVDIFRAWRDEDYRVTLNRDQISGAPENPAGVLALGQVNPARIQGGVPPILRVTTGECTLQPAVVPGSACFGAVRGLGRDGVWPFRPGSGSRIR